MATGWAGDNAVQDQIDATIKDAIKKTFANVTGIITATHTQINWLATAGRPSVRSWLAHPKVSGWRPTARGRSAGGPPASPPG